MGRAKDIVVKPIAAKDANALVKKLHYTGKVDPRSSLHLGVFLNGKCGGAMSFGAPIDKNKALPLVEDTPWNGMLDLHRLAFADWLPRNSESRAIAFAMRWIKKTYPHIQSFKYYPSMDTLKRQGIGQLYIDKPTKNNITFFVQNLDSFPMKLSTSDFDSQRHLYGAYFCESPKIVESK